MVRQLNALRTPAWKAVLAVAVAGAALLWHILACMESPMAFSPSGKELAFVVAEPYTDKELHLAGRRTYRLMVLSEQKRFRVIEQTDKDLLTAPAYSPDGRQLCYLRLPLLTEDKAAELKTKMEERAKAVDAPDAQVAKPPAGPGGAEQGQTEDLSLPPARTMAEFHKGLLLAPELPCTLVVRDAAAPDVLLAAITVDLPLFAESDLSAGYTLAQAAARPQYSPDGQWVYVCAGSVAAAVNVKSGQRRILAAPAAAAALAPDGRMLAVMVAQRVLAFVQTDGQRMACIRTANDMTLGAMAWVDGATLAVLDHDAKGPAVRMMRTDGTVVKTVPIPKADPNSRGEAIHLALGPGGRHAAVASADGGALFLDAAGNLLRALKKENEGWFQPTFAPDGRSVAFKHMVKAERDQAVVAGIAFFSPEGKELAYAKLPPASPATGPAATEPTGAAAPRPAKPKDDGVP